MRERIRIFLSSVSITLVLLAAYTVFGHPLSQSELNDISLHEDTIASATEANEVLFEVIDDLASLIDEGEQQEFPDWMQIFAWNFGILLANVFIAENNESQVDAVNAINEIYDSHGHT